jgi:Xaa-Pro aminopeptidase
MSSLETLTESSAAAVQSSAAPHTPFNHELLDRLLDDAGVDVLLATSKHNVQYLLGGYRFFFFDYMDAIGSSRYLPVVVYVKGRPERAAYVGNRLEKFEKELGRFWTPVSDTSVWTSVDAIRVAAAHLRSLGLDNVRIGVEPPFLPLDAAETLQRELPSASIVDAYPVLEQLRSRKTSAELELLRTASERVIGSMLATMALCRPGMTKHDVVAELRRQEVGRDLTFEYCLITAGSNLNRSPSDQRIEAGDIISLDSGGNYRGYIGDLCRMGILGEPDPELEDLLGHIREIQDVARAALRPGGGGRAVYEAAESLVRRSPHAEHLDFLAHGMGLVSHEAPQLTSRGFVPYQGRYAEGGLEPGMVVSIETAMLHPRRGFIKLEDTVAITATGTEGFGDAGRGWNRAGDGQRL